MNIEAAFNNCTKQIVRSVHIVVDRVALCSAGFHRIGGGPLFGEVHHGTGALTAQQTQQQVVVLGDIERNEVDGPATGFLPGPQPVVDRGDRRERFDPEVDVDLAAAQVVDDHDVVTCV